MALIKQHRIGVFETNSSSSHSISICTTKPALDTLVPDDDGLIRSSGEEFGWENRTYLDARTKLDYLVTHLFSYCRSYKDVLKVKHENQNFKMLEDVIQEHCGALLEVEPHGGNYPDDGGGWYALFGYIDHQSAHLPEEIFTSKSNVASFLFNPQSSLTTGNDN